MTLICLQTTAVKFIRIEVDDNLFEAIANDKQIQAMGISEYCRRAAKFFLELKTEYEIDKKYEYAYCDPRARETLESEVKEWIDGQVWEDWDETEWLKAAASNPAFESLKDSAEDVYTLKDGRPFHNENE